MSKLGEKLIAAAREGVVLARQHIGCNVTTCPNGKCRATGECINLAAERARQSERHGG